MRITENAWIEAKRLTVRRLIDELLSRCDYASALVVDSKSRAYSLSKRGISAADMELLSTRGFTVKVVQGDKRLEYSLNELTEENIPEVVKSIENALMNCPTSPLGLPDDEPLTLSEASEYEIDPVELGDERIIALLDEIRKRGLKSDPAIIDCVTNCSYRVYSKLFISKNRELSQSIMWCNGAIWAIAGRGDIMRDSYRGYSKLGGAELLNSMKDGVDKVCGTAVELLDAQPMPAGEYECICSPETTGMIVHEAFGHGVEMDMFVKDRAQAKEFIGKYVASPLVTMHDGAVGVDETASFFFDDEGSLACDTVIIDKGILKKGMCDQQSARRLGVKPTGNGRRSSFERKAYARMTNTYFEAGNDSLEDMFASVDYGFLLENPTSGMEDPKNWGIQCMVGIAREIKDGKLTGRVFSPVVLTGYVPDLLKSITMMSREVELCGSGFCGKGYKEWLKVSDGGPWIKARIRLG